MAYLPRFLHPLGESLGRDLWPQDRLALVETDGESLLDYVFSGKVAIEGDADHLSIELTIGIVQEVVIPLPLSEGTAIVIGASESSGGDAPEPRLLGASFVLGWPPVEEAQPVDPDTGLPVEEPPGEPGVPDADRYPERPAGPPPWQVRLDLDLLSLRFGRDLIVPVEIDAETHEVTVLDGNVHLDFGCTLKVDHQGNLDFGFGSAEGGGAVALELSSPFQIGDSGVAVTVGELYLRFSPETPAPDWAPADQGPGVYLEQLAVLLPPELSVGILEGIEATNVVIATGGFSGTLALTWAQRLVEDAEPPRFEPGPGAGDLFGMQFALSRLDFSVVQNAFARASLQCDLIPPVIEKPLGLMLAIDGDGHFTAEVKASTLPGAETQGSLIRLRQENLLELLVRSARFELAEDVGTFSLAGSLKPLVGGIDWPTLEVEKLSINTKGEVDLDGGWIDVPESLSLDFHAFKIELDRVGLGTEGTGADEREWVGLSGGIELIEGIPLSASVDGLKVSWRPRRDPTVPYDPDVQVTLEGIALHLEIPGTLVLDGRVNYRELPRPPATRPAGETTDAAGAAGLFGHVFSGSISVELTCINTEIAGELLIGDLTNYHYDSGGNLVTGESFTALYIVLAAELPTAIPLGATGAGLYGIKGLFGMHVAPDRQLDAEGEPESWYAWYKADRGSSGPYTVTKVSKWAPKFDHYAFGAGITIGTVYDDGFTINVGALAAILIPGPIVMIEGRANLLKQRSGDGQGMEGALYALIVFDGIAETFQMNVDVNFTLEDVVSVTGGLEAFFDFNDGNAWYVYMGRKDPESKRIRAEVLSIITATSYFMIDPRQILFGATAGIDLELQYGPLEIRIILRIGFEIGLFFKEPQLTGMIDLYGELTIRVFGIGISLILQTLLEGSAPQPWWIHGLARAALSLPFPLPSFDVQVEFTWGQSGAPAAVDLIKSAAMVHPKLPGTTWELPAASAPVAEWPVIPVDAIPVLSLAKPLSDVSLERTEGDATRSFTVETVEGFEFGYSLRNVVLEEPDGAGGWRPRLSIPAPRVADVRLRPDLYAREPQAELWWYAPLDTWDNPSRRNYVDPCDAPPSPKRQCVDWRDVAIGTFCAPVFRRGGLSFASGMASPGEVRAVPPASPTDPDRGLAVRHLVVHFPEPVSWVEIRWGNHDATFKGFLDGRAVTLASLPAGARSYQPFGAGSASIALDTLHIDAMRDPLDATRVEVLTSICWITQRDFGAASRRGSTGDRTQMRSALVLEPYHSYRLKVTGVRTRRQADSDQPATEDPLQTVTYGFRTGGLPGTDYEDAKRAGLIAGPPSFAEGPLNRVESYVARTIPANGAPLFYRGYDVAVELKDPYAAAMLAPILELRVLDRNGKDVAGTPAFRLLTGDTPFLTPGLLTLLTAPRERECETTPVSWTRRVLQKLIACTLPPQTRQGRMVRVELVARFPYGRETVFGFEFATSRFLDAPEHLRSGLVGAAGTDPATWRDRPLRRLGAASAPPVDWIAPLSTRLGEIATTRAALAAALTVGEHDAGMTIVEATETLAGLKAELGVWSAAVYGLIDQGGTLAPPWGTGAPMTYGGLASLFAAVGLAHRPLPPRNLEALSIDAGSGYFVLLESPEPLDWGRITIRRADTGAALPVLPSADGTRAFLFDSGAGGLFAPGPRTVRVAFHRGGVNAPDLEPLYRDGALTPIEEEVVWNLVPAS